MQKVILFLQEDELIKITEEAEKILTYFIIIVRSLV